MLLLRGTDGGVSFSPKVDDVEADGRIGRCSVRHETVNPAPNYDENQLERLELGVPWRLWPYPGTGVLCSMSAANN